MWFKKILSSLVDIRKSKDLEDLITAVKKKVYEKTGINLETEIQIMGEHV